MTPLSVSALPAAALNIRGTVFAAAHAGAPACVAETAPPATTLLAEGEPAAMTDPAAELLRLRASIDNLDAILLHTLAERFKVTQAVGELKARHNMPPADKAREARQIERLRRLATESGLDPVFAEKFLNFIVAEVIRHHEQLRGQQAAPPPESRNSTQE